MSENLILLTLMSIGLCSCGQSGKSTQDKITIDVETEDSTKTKRYKILTFDPESFTESEFKYTETFIDTEFKYTDSTGNDVIIQNSFPKGGGDIDGIRGYYDSFGTHYGYGIFWTRVINKTTTQLDLSINFPAELFAISHSPDSYFKLYLPPDTMTVDKLSLYNYGITGLKPFLDTNFHKPTVLHRTINPNEACLFLIGLLIHVDNGTIRAGLISKEQDLFYRISIDPLGSTEIPCGRILFNQKFVD